MTVDLVEFLTARLDEDEQTALAASPGPWRPGEEHDDVIAVDDITVAEGFALSGRQLRATVDHIACHDPARVLAEVDAKRRLVELHSTPHTVVDGFCVEEGGPCTHRGEDECTLCGETPCATLRLLALPYAGHADYDEAWRP